MDGMLDKDAMLTGLYTVAAGWVVLLLLSGPGRTQVGALVSKLPLGLSVVAHLLLSADKSGLKKKIVDADVIAAQQGVQSKRVVFIRHGESDWNEIFNRGFGPMFPVRVVTGLLRELFKLPSRDSLFVDSPLSDLGARQAAELRKFLATPQTDARAAELVATLNGEGGSSVTVTSNLRRAIATAVIGLADRLRRGRGQMLVVSDLQEISKNPDALALAQPRALPDLSQLEAQLGAEGLDLAAVLDPAANKGNKPLRSKGKDRLGQFAEWVFTRPEDTVIATGHSLWFKAFFNVFLPQASKHQARNKKISNCAVVAFTLTRGTHEGKPQFRIDPDSVTMLTGKYI